MSDSSSEPISESYVALHRLQVVIVAVVPVEPVEDSERIAQSELPMLPEHESDAAVYLQVEMPLRDSLAVQCRLYLVYDGLLFFVAQLKACDLQVFDGSGMVVDIDIDVFFEAVYPAFQA